MNTKSKFTKNEDKNENKRLFKTTLIGSLCALICTITLSFLLSILVLQSPDPEALTLPVAYIISALSLFFSGIISARISEGNMLSCALSGVVFAIVCLFTHITINGGTGVLSALFLVFPGVSTLGGILAKPKDKKRNSKFRKRKF